MSVKKKDKNNLLIFLVVVFFLVILIAWRAFLKFIPTKVQPGVANNIFPALFDQGVEIKTGLDQIIYPLLNSQILNNNLVKSENDDVQSEEIANILTDGEAKKIEEKILEYLNQKKSE